MSVKDIEGRVNMKERLTIRKRGQVTLPKSFIEKYNLEEGDSLELEVTNDGEVKVWTKKVTGIFQFTLRRSLTSA